MTDPLLLARRLGIRLMELARKTDALALHSELETGQWLNPRELAAVQFDRLRDHLIFCRDEVPYYGRLFADLGFDPEAFSDVADLQALPLMEKQLIRAEGDQLHSASMASRRPRFKQTSGSTGVPLNYYLDSRSHSYLWGHIWRAWGQTGYRPGDYYATLSGGSLLPEKVDLKQRVYLFLSGCLHLPSYHLTEQVMARYAATLAGRRVKFLYGYPSSVEVFAAYLRDTGKMDFAIQSIFTTSELLTRDARALIEKSLGGTVYDIYGCNDGGIHSFECERHDGYHQGMESCLVEIVDDDGRQVPDGTIGRIVTTHFANRSHPFLRYVTGDRGALNRERCACGRGLLRVVELQGRERDVVLTPDGRKIHGAFFNHFEPFYEAEWLDRYQVHQLEVELLEIWALTSREPTEEELDVIRRELQRGLGPVTIVFKFVEEFELTSTGKFRVVISHLD